MRVLHIVAPGEIGGLERVVQLLAHGQARDGADVHVALVVEPGSANHALLTSLTAGGVTTHPIAVSSRAYWRVLMWWTRVRLAGWVFPPSRRFTAS